MRRTTLARRYAKALLDIAVEENAVEKYGSELRDLLAVSKGNPEFVRVLQNPMFGVPERKGLIGAVLDKLGASETVKKFGAVLIDNSKADLIDDICTSYFVLEDELTGRLRVTVTSAKDADETFLTNIKEKLAAETGKIIILTHATDEALIGGFVLNLGNTIFDGSVKGQLELIKEKMVGGTV